MTSIMTGMRQAPMASLTGQIPAFLRERNSVLLGTAAATFKLRIGGPLDGTMAATGKTTHGRSLQRINGTRFTAISHRVEALSGFAWTRSSLGLASLPPTRC